MSYEPGRCVLCESDREGTKFICALCYFGLPSSKREEWKKHTNESQDAPSPEFVKELQAERNEVAK